MVLILPPKDPYVTRKCPPVLFATLFHILFTPKDQKKKKTDFIMEKRESAILKSITLTGLLL